MTTASDLIAGALRVISTVSPGEPIAGEDAANALNVLNRMLKSWSASCLMIPYRTLENFPLTTGKANYTIGPDADFDTVRPDYLTYAYRRDATGNDYPLEIIPKDSYNPIYLKSFAGLPDRIYYDAQYPNGLLYLYPCDFQSGTLWIETLKPMNVYSSLTADIALPGEYEEAIVYLLAQRLAPEYGFSIAQNPDIIQLVKSAQEFIKRRNCKPQRATFDMRRHPAFNVFEG